MNPLPVLFGAVLVASPITSQQLLAGLQAQTESLPTGSGNVLQTTSGLVVFDGQALQLLSAHLRTHQRQLDRLRTAWHAHAHAHAHASA
jgi:hypothetical protein